MANPDEIDLDDDDDSDEDETNGQASPKVIGGLEKQAIPSQVFGSLKKDDDDE